MRDLSLARLIIHSLINIVSDTNYKVSARKLIENARFVVICSNNKIEIYKMTKNNVNSC